ncbi:Protein kinase, putative [Hondaea fermentalgiana]|uniref:Protein kinase, putative n=1 Tax=Hondaea fermentalgiana TaxID=2315210 RepID=A0A2R5GDY8_9STRA|nr:Protein kinase, putative [Hondaea fermentalgiana]|eukprot:GBG28539.1 Protein kinase, putative [Hondaea fermentalgiana]
MRFVGNGALQEAVEAIENGATEIEYVYDKFLNYNKCGDEGATALANALANNELLQTLDLRLNNIGAEGATALANVLANNESLQTLVLKYNHIGYEGATALANALASNESLYMIDLEENNIGPEGATALTNALANNESLHTLDLEENNIGPEGATALANALANNESLQTLNLLFNNIGDEGATALANALAINVSLHTLNIGHEGATALANALVKNVSLHTLSKLEILAAELSNARAKRSEEKAGLHHIMLRDFFAEQLSRENPIAIVADFDLQQATVSEKEQALATLQEAVKTDPEKIPERNQMRRDLIASIRETLAKSSQNKLRELEDDANDVANICRKLSRDILGEPANIDDAAELVTFGQVQEATRTMMEAIKAWEARHDTAAARERTTAALNALEESTKCLGIQPTFFMTLTYPERSQELVLKLQDVHQAFVAELSALEKGDHMADALLDKVRRALACMFSFYTRTISSVVSRIKDLGHLLSHLMSGLTEPNTEDAELLLKSLRNKTRKCKRLAFDLDDAREDARGGDEEAQARIVDLEQELAQIGSVDKLDSELRKKRARLLRHAEEHYPELLRDQEWLKRLGLGDDGAPLELSKLGLWRTTARREHFVTLKELASKPGKSVQKVRGPDGRDLVLKAFHLASEAWSSRFYHQVTALAQIQSAYIVQIQGAFMQAAREGCILMPFYPGGDLATWIRDHSHADLATRLRIAIGLLSGLHDLHSRGFVHCDVKPENVFLAKGLSPVLGDFDGVQTHNVTMTQPMQATIKYMAPELRNGNIDKVEPAVDMFSVGVVLAELFDGSEVSDAIQALVSSLQSADPTQRPTALEALRHEALQVELVKEASCAICLDVYPVSEGVSCADGHFTCKECLSRAVRAATDSQSHVKVRRDGSMCCVAPDCELLVSGRAIASAVPDEDFTALLDIVRAHFERDAAAEQERQLRDRVDAALREHRLDRTTQNHIRAIQDEVLAMSCPRCSTVFADFDGCCALKCGACSCYFCAWCLQDTGNDADACRDLALASNYKLTNLVKNGDLAGVQRAEPALLNAAVTTWGGTLHKDSGGQPAIAQWLI